MIAIGLTTDHDDDALDLWASVVACFPVDAVYVVGARRPRSWGRFKVWRDAEPISRTDLPRVYFSPPTARVVPGSVALPDFVHPPEAVYVFGGDHSILTLDAGEAPIVFIPSDRAELYSHAAGAIALYDRATRGAHG